MSVLRFVDDIVGHIAWPLVVLVAIFVFREDVSRMLDDMTKADFSFGKNRFILKKRARDKIKSELEYVGVDLTSDEGRDSATKPRTESSPAEEALPIDERDAAPDRNRPFGFIKWSADDWRTVESYLRLNPHYAIHLAGLRVEAALTELVGSDPPPLFQLVKPGYLVSKGVISQELADASMRLLQVKNRVEGSPKFMLTHEIAESYVVKAHELVVALEDLRPQ